MFADMFDLNPLQLTCVIGTVFIGMLLMIRSRRSLKNTQEHWDELRSTLHTTETVATTQKANPKPKQTLRSNDDSTVYLPDHSVEMEQVEARIRQLEREAAARIDTKIAVMQQLLIQTDSAINKLQYALDSAVRVGLLDQNPMPRRNVEETTAPIKNGTDSRITRTDQKQDQTHVLSGRVNLPPKLDEDPRFVRVYALADANLSATKIASQTGMQIGEVELILSLRPKQKSATT